MRRNGAVAWLTLSRPEAGNAFNQELADTFSRIIDDLAADPECRVLMLAGSGKLFCAGGDVAGIHGADDPAGYLKHLAETIHRSLVKLETSRIAVVSVVNGAAAGAGLGLVVNSDLVLAGPRAVFLSAYAGVGLNPDCGVSRKLPEVVGQRRALEMTLSGRTLDPATALDWGLVNEVYDDDEELARRAEQLALQLSTGAGDVIGLTKQLVRSRSTGYGQHLDDEVAGLMDMIAQPETIARMAAFLARGTTKA